jgi:hypothetical protein
MYPAVADKYRIISLSTGSSCNQTAAQMLSLIKPNKKRVLIF